MTPPFSCSYVSHILLLLVALCFLILVLSFCGSLSRIVSSASEAGLSKQSLPYLSYSSIHPDYTMELYTGQITCYQHETICLTVEELTAAAEMLLFEARTIYLPTVLLQKNRHLPATHEYARQRTLRYSLSLTHLYYFKFRKAPFLKRKNERDKTT